MNFADSAIALARNFLCQQISTTAGWAASTAAAALRFSGAPLDPSQADSLAQNAVGGLLLCPSDSGPYPALPPAQFVGGQCPTAYRVRADITYTPVSGPPEVTERFGDGDQNQYQGPLGEPVASISSGNRITINWTNSNATVIGPFFSGDAPTFEPIYEVVNGTPDDCGEMTGGTIIGQPQNADLTYDGPDGNPVTEPVTVTVGGPIVEVNGAISFPVNIIGSGNLTVVNFPGNGGPPEFGYPGADPRANRCCPDPSPLFNPPDPGDDPPEEDPEGPLVGIWIKSVIPTTGFTSTQVGLTNGPNAVFPRIGSVTFGVNTGGALAWLNPIDFQVSPCFIPVPDPLLAIDVKVNPLKNVTIETQRIYRKPDIILS